MSRHSMMATVFVLAGVFAGATAAADRTVIKIGYGTAGGPIHEAALEFKKSIEKADPSIEVQVFPGGQLGSEGEIIGQLQAGLTDMLATTTGPLGQHNPVYYVLETPYVFINDAQADKVLDGPVGAELLKGMDAKGLVGLTFWENGFRELTNNTRPIRAPGDLKGIKLRTQQNRLHMKYFGDLGASPTPTAFTEIYNALATHIVDGQENPLSLIATNKFYEQQKYVSKTDHVYSSVPVYYSKIKWDKLPAATQKLVKDTVHDLRLWERKRGRDQQQAYLDEIGKKSQIAILTDAEKAEFQKAAAPAFEWAKKEYGAVYQAGLDKVLKAATE